MGSKISFFIIALLTIFIFSGCAGPVSKGRIILDAQNEFHKIKGSADVISADLKDCVRETPCLISAQVLLTVRRHGYSAQAGREAYTKQHYKLTYQKIGDRWDLVDIRQGMY